MAEKPIVYIFHGDDELAINQAVERLYNQLGDPVTAEMNTTRLDGTVARKNDLLNAAATMPFLAERRLVILTHPLARLSEKNSQKQFCDLLENLPETAAIVLVVADQQKFKQGAWGWETLSDSHWLCQWHVHNKGRALIKAFPLPQAAEMPDWIKKKAVEMGGQFDRDAAKELAGLVENDTRIAAQEITKLLTFVNYERPVSVKDVQNLVAFQGEANIFEMTDAIGNRNATKALELLHQLLEDQDEKNIFPMVVRQFRLLIQVRALLDEGANEESIQKTLKVLPFIARKLSNQARQFSMPRLKALYGELLKMDIASKSPEMSISLALDLFISELL